MSWRDTKNEARRVVHDTMRVAAVYLSPDDVPVETELDVRVLTKWEAQGDLQGFDYTPAERNATTPQIVNMIEELRPERLGIFSIAEGEAYQVETVDPPDGITITSQVWRITDAAALAALPVPAA